MERVELLLRVGQHAGEQLVQQDARRPDVGGGRILAAERLGRHVGGRAREKGGVAGRFEHAGEAEVGEARSALLQQDVAGLEVAVDKARLVQILKTVEDAAGHGHGGLDRGSFAAVARQPVRERSARHVLAGDHDLAIVHFGFEHGNDVGVPARPQPDLRLLPDRLQVRVGVERELQRDLRREQRRAPIRQPDLAERSATQRADEGIRPDRIACSNHLSEVPPTLGTRPV